LCWSWMAGCIRAWWGAGGTCSPSEPGEARGRGGG
jgi:hypothetical protein